MNKYKIVITDHEYKSIDNEINILSQLDADVIDCQTKDQGELIKILKDADAVIIQYAKMSKEIIDAMTKCKIIAKYATGIDNVDIERATEKGICFTNVNDYCADEVSTHSVALLLEAVRHVGDFNEKVKAGQWYGTGIKIPSLKKSVIGVISFGRIARMYIDKIKPLCDEIWVFDKFVSSKDILAYGVKPKTFEEILLGADYISVHAPLTEETRHMFNKDAFEKMKRSAVIINVARGGLLCEDDLKWALENKEISGAVLDVLEQEPPLKDNPLLKMENVIITPHTAWYSESSQKILQSTPAEDVVRVLKGERPLNLVNKDVVFPAGKQ